MTRPIEHRCLKRTLVELSWAASAFRRRLRSRVTRSNDSVVRPQLPSNADGRILVHLGCGEIDCPGFINVDYRPAPHVHYVQDVCDLSIFPNNYADLVYACHLLEHIRHTAVRQTLWEWRRVLKPGGVLRLSVPDFDKLLEIYQSSHGDITTILKPLMGGQNYEENAHHCVFNHAYLTDKLREVGFQEIRDWVPDRVPDHDFKDLAGSDVVLNGKAYPVSLNIEAVK